MNSVVLPRSIVNQVLAHAQRSPESEVCGLVGARGGEPQRVYPVGNVADEPSALFRMDPKGQVDAMRRMREAGETLFAIYHSHPRSPAEPSARDLAEAAYPEALYLIVSLDTEGVLQMRAFRLENGAISDVDLVVA